MATNIQFPLVAVNTQFGSKTVFLPPAISKVGCFFIVYDSDGFANFFNTITVQTVGGELIDQLTSIITLNNPYDSICLLSGGASGWWIVSRGNKP